MLFISDVGRSIKNPASPSVHRIVTTAIAIDSLSVTGINQYAAQRNHGVMNDAARGIPQTKTFYMLIQMFLCLISL